MRAYYNEIDPYAAQWLRNLIARNLIAPGDVDTRPIQDVAPDDLDPYAQCHFFAGIGGWSRALRLAAVPDHCPVWTGSCPCQPFSAAGRQGGFADERHLWPFFHHHIRVRRPAVVLGEQVGGPAGLAWLDLVCADMEAEGYAVGAADLPAACVGAPHIRQRLFFVAHRDRQGRGEQRGLRLQRPEFHDADGRGADVELGNPRFAGSRWDGRALPRAQAAGWADGGEPHEPGVAGEPRALAHGGGARLEVEREQQAWGQREAAQRGGEANGVGDTARDGQRQSWFFEAGDRRSSTHGGSGAWDDIEWLPCRDDKWRPTKPGLFPLAHGVSNRVAQLRAIGNAIVPQVAAEFIRVALDL